MKNQVRFTKTFLEGIHIRDLKVVYPTEADAMRAAKGMRLVTSDNPLRDVDTRKPFYYSEVLVEAAA